MYPKKQEKNNKRQGYVAMAFSFLLYLVLGTIFLWGNLNTYMTVLFGSQTKANIVYPLSIIVMGSNL